jgi:hypothetical protein
MDIFIDINLLKEHNLTPNSYVYLFCLRYDIEFPWGEASQQMLNTLEEGGWIKSSSKNVTLRVKFDYTFSTYISGVKDKSEPITKLAEFTEQWRNLFPSGIKSGSRPVRGDKKSILRKMSLFTKSYPEYSYQEILDATRAYIFEKKNQDYKFMICADYFISKDGVSALASWLEIYKEKGLDFVNMEQGGGSAFHKEV